MNKNIKFNEDHITITINPKIYPLNVIYLAAYSFLDKAYLILNGDPKKEILINIKSKNKKDIEKIGYEFFNELLNYSTYNKISKENKDIKTAIIQKALLINDPSLLFEDEIDEETKKILEELENEDDDFEDPEGIAIPWEEKYGNKNEKNNSSK